MNRPNLRRFTLSAFTAAVLTACSSVSEPEVQPPIRYNYALSADISPQDTREAVEAQYGGEVLIWHPEAGFAVLGVEGSLTPLKAEVQRDPRQESNLDVFSIPSVNAQGRNAWAGGRNAWAGGWDAWAGGAEDGATTTLEENLAAWRQIDLVQGQTLAPKLGRGVKVAVIDSGLDVYHPALRGKLAPEREWRDFIDGDKLPLDERDPDGRNEGYGHGTGVAGIILQVAPEATILPLRVLRPDGGGDLTDVAMAIDWAAQQGADIINLSLGAASDTDSEVVARILTYARERHGVLFVASSGNTGDDKVTFPAHLAQRSGFDSLVSVGSVDVQNVRSDFSTYGPDVSLYAPGEKVYTLMPGKGVTDATGTSFAAPIVAGTLALALGDTEGVESISHVQTLLMAVNGEMDSRDETATGLLDAGRFLTWARADAPSGVSLSNNTVLENQDAGVTVGRFSVTESSVSSSVSYRLVAGEADNSSFVVAGDELRTAERFDFEARSSYSVLIEAEGAGGVSRQGFAVSIRDVDEEKPVVTLDTPETLILGETATLTGTAGDNDGVSGLELYEDETKLGDATSSLGTWSYRYTPDSAGTFTLKIIASDAAGNQEEATLSVTVLPPAQWPVQFGNDVDDGDAEGIAADAAGNLYLAGKVQPPGGEVSSRDAFVMKLNRRGDEVWSQQIVSSNTDEAESVAVDAAGNLYVAGYTSGNLGDTNAGGTDAFIAQYDSSSGAQNWIRQFGDVGLEEIEDLVVDAAGNIYVTGYTSSDLAGANAGGLDVFVAKYHSDGSQIWLEQFGSAANEEAKAIAVDTAGNLYLAGYTGGDLAGASAGGFDIFLAKYGSEGNQLWLEQFGTAVDDEGEGVAVDAAGRIYVAGSTRGSLVNTNVGNTDVFVARYGGGGNRAWLRQFGGAADDGATGAATDPEGNVIVTGYTYGEAAGTHAGLADIIVMKYDSAGNQIWADQFGDVEDDEAEAIATDSRGNSFITGHTHSNLAGESIGGQNIFVMKLDSSGAAQ